MFEALISLGVVVVFCVLTFAAKASAEAVLVGGLGLAAVGFAYGIPTAIVYHWLLHRSLVRHDRLPPRWWLSPTSHHELVPSADRPRILLWAGIGGSGFLVVVLGILVTSIGLWRARGL